MTVPNYDLDPAAENDLDHYADYLIAEAGHDVALDFVECARRSFLAIAAAPLMAPAVPTRNPRLSGLRKWRIERFPKMLIFYLPTQQGIEIVRVLHAAQDWWTALDID